MFTYSLSLKLTGLNTLQNLTNSKFTYIFSKNKLQSKLKKMFRISYFEIQEMGMWTWTFLFILVSTITLCWPSYWKRGCPNFNGKISKEWQSNFWVCLAPSISVISYVWTWTFLFVLASTIILCWRSHWNWFTILKCTYIACNYWPYHRHRHNQAPIVNRQKELWNILGLRIFGRFDHFFCDTFVFILVYP